MRVIRCVPTNKLEQVMKDLVYEVGINNVWAKPAHDGFFDVYYETV